MIEQPKRTSFDFLLGATGANMLALIYAPWLLPVTAPFLIGIAIWWITTGMNAF